MSITKEEIIWLMENCGEDPCGAHGSEEVETIQADDTIVTISGKPDHEIEMAHKQLHRTAKQSQSLADRLRDMEEANLPGWVQSKITMASDYISKVHGYLDDLFPEPTEENTGITIMKEEMEGEVAMASHDIEIELNITKSDMEKLHDGEKVVLNDETGNNNFKVTIVTS